LEVPRNREELLSNFSQYSENFRLRERDLEFTGHFKSDNQVQMKRHESIKSRNSQLKESKKDTDKSKAKMQNKTRILMKKPAFL
jgi:hypothetical protein